MAATRETRHFFIREKLLISPIFSYLYVGRFLGQKKDHSFEARRSSCYEKRVITILIK